MPTYKYVPSVMFKITNCQKCPNCTTELTKGYGYALDYLCKETPDPEAKHGLKVIKGYVEWGSEEPQDGQIPDWCPLIKKRKKTTPVDKTKE